ncbi:hypothetical protein ACVMYR_28250 [Micromonospora sp. PTRAS2]
MPTINWDTVATAAATAVFVTLAVEYAAKPRLEARKERILAAGKSRRALSAAITSIAIPAAFLSVDLPKEMRGDVREAVRAERRRQYERMREQAQRLVDGADEHVGTFLGRSIPMVMSYITTVHGIMLSARTRHDKAQMIYDLSKQMGMVLDGRWWQMPARVRALWELERLVKRSQEQGEDEDEAARGSVLSVNRQGVITGQQRR